MSASQDYSYTAWTGFGGASAPPAPISRYPTSVRNSPNRWPAAVHNHTQFPNATAGNPESVGNQPSPGNGYGVGALSYFQPSLSDILKRILCDRIAHAGSKVVGFHEEECGPGRSRMTVTFETSGQN